MSTIVSVDTRDIRFPTSLALDGSDAMNPDPDYSAAYVVHPHRRRRRPSRATRSSSRSVAATTCRSPRSTRSAGTCSGSDVEQLLGDMGAAWRLLAHDSQLRWLGPEKGVMHMAIGAVINALWDLKAKRAGLPLWQLLVGLSPEAARRRSSTSATSPTRSPPTRRSRSSARPSPAAPSASPSCSRSATPPTRRRPGWLGYSDEKLDRLCREAVADGFPQIKLKVGGRPRRRPSGGSASRARPSATAYPDRDRREPAVGRRRRDRVGQRARPSSTWPGSRSRRVPTTSSVTPRSRAGVAPDPGRDGRARAEPGRVQAAAPGRGHGRHADRRDPRGRGQREHREPAARGEVRRAGLPARRRRRPVRGRAAPVDVRLRRGLGHAWTVA